MKPDRTQPYNNLPLIPPEIDLKDKDILLATLDASDTIAQLNTILTVEARSLFNSFDMISPLFVPEAVTSSGIENIITTNDSVYVAKILEKRELTPAEKEALNYTQAIIFGFVKLDKQNYLATNDYIKLQRILEPNKQGIRKQAGTDLRNQSGYIYYTPPTGEGRIRSLLLDFERYFNEESPKAEIFARMAILHYQFEAIHPFSDGNGRTGRMLMPLYLVKQKRLSYPILFISHYIIEHRDEYYKKLRDVTFEQKWKDWILYILAATTEQAKYTCEILEKIRNTINSIRARLKSELTTVNSTELVDFLFSNVYFTQKDFEKAIKISPMTARKYLAKLETGEIIKKSKQTGRNRFIYITPDYIKILRRA